MNLGLLLNTVSSVDLPTFTCLDTIVILFILISLCVVVGCCVGVGVVCWKHSPKPSLSFRCGKARYGLAIFSTHLNMRIFACTLDGSV